MVQRQPGRPAENEFTGAARRFLEDKYEPEVLHTTMGYFTTVHQVYPVKAADQDIIRRERIAEGQAGREESLRDFALRQLSNYQKLRKD